MVELTHAFVLAEYVWPLVSSIYHMRSAWLRSIDLLLTGVESVEVEPAGGKPSLRYPVGRSQFATAANCLLPGILLSKYSVAGLADRRGCIIQALAGPYTFLPARRSPSVFASSISPRLPPSTLLSACSPRVVPRHQ